MEPQSGYSLLQFVPIALMVILSVPPSVMLLRRVGMP